MPTVAILHSEDKYRSIGSIYSMLRELLEHFGGFGAFVKPGQTVLIKPDQSIPYLAEGGSTTDPLLIGALIRLAQHTGAAKVQVAASSAGFLNSIECMKATGVADVAARERAELVDLGGDQVPHRQVDLPEGQVLRHVQLPVPLLEADAVIAVPKAKTDSLDLICGAMELCTGGVNQKWRELQSAEDDFMERLADILTVLRPDLYIADALICGEGDGPHANYPCWCGCLLASADPVATDAAIATLLGRDFNKLRFARAAEERGLGSKEPIVFLGTPLERVAIHAWPSHESFEHLPINVLIGKGVTESGTIRHVKSALETLVRRELLQEALRKAGTPTVMIGDTEDPEFERHLAEGPYIVFDDTAPGKYKYDPRVFFVPGHPVAPQVAMKEFMRALRVEGKLRTSDSSRPRRPGAATAALAGLAVSAMIWMRGSGRRP